MSNLNFRYLPQSIVITIDDEIYIADESHPYFAAICLMAENDDPKVVHMFDVAQKLQEQFTQVTSRISVKGNEVLLDGEPLSNPYVEKLVSSVGSSDDGRAKAWARFFEKLSANPNPTVADQLARWMQATGEDWEITEDGNFIGYRGCMDNGQGEYVSKFKGTARVDGVLYEDAHIPNPVGATITMPRAEVTFDPNEGCAPGLHVGTKGYATNWTSTNFILRIEVDPTNVVSVPMDAGDQKIRVCAFDIEDTEFLYDDDEFYDDADYGFSGYNYQGI